jgi:hypothetical protein
MKLNYVVVDAIKYSFSFFNKHFWALMRMLLIFMAISIAMGLVVAGASLLLLQSLSNNIWLMVALESPLLAAVGYIFFGIWSVSFITYVLALERTGFASIKEHLKNSLSMRVLKIIAFDLIKVLFIAMIAVVVASVAAGAWWFGGMQLALWHRVVLSLVSAVLSLGIFYLYIRLFFTKIIIADTDADIFAAFATSWSATGTWVWRLVAMFIAIGLMSGIVSIVMTQLSALIVALSGDALAGRIVGNTMQVLGALFNMVFPPIIVLYYYNYLKVAKGLRAGR